METVAPRWAKKAKQEGNKLNLDDVIRDASHELGELFREQCNIARDSINAEYRRATLDDNEEDWPHNDFVRSQESMDHGYRKLEAYAQRRILESIGLNGEKIDLAAYKKETQEIKQKAIDSFTFAVEKFKLTNKSRIELLTDKQIKSYVRKMDVIINEAIKPHISIALG